jgi:flagellar basal-body rod protein FlgG
MSGAFQIAAVGLEAQQRALDTIANNISNVNTPAFKRSDIQFSEILATQPDAAALRADLGQSLVTTAGVRADALFRLNEQGRVEPTGQAMDLAIDGGGFIELMGPEGQTLLWRGGGLRVGEDGMLAAAGNGFALKAGLTVPTDASAIQIGADGIVRATVGEGTDPVEIGQIMLVKVDSPEGVERLDGGLYRVTDATRLTDSRPGEDGAGRLIQGSLERSTVELTSEMVQLMLVQRAYAANAQLVQAADQLMGLANGLRR